MTFCQLPLDPKHNHQQLVVHCTKADASYLLPVPFMLLRSKPAPLEKLTSTAYSRTHPSTKGVIAFLLDTVRTGRMSRSAHSPPSSCLLPSPSPSSDNHPRNLDVEYTRGEAFCLAPRFPLAVQMDARLVYMVASLQ